jgi:hypothetical protein
MLLAIEGQQQFGGIQSKKNSSKESFIQILQSLKQQQQQRGSVS